MQKIKIVVAGSDTPLGKSLIKFLHQNDNFCLCPLFEDSDIKDDDTNMHYLDGKILRKAIISHRPDFVINCIGKIDLAYCEAEKKSAHDWNVGVAENIIKATKISDAHCILLSSGLVFDGKKQFYSEEDKQNPLNYFGKTKLEMENFCKSSQVIYTIIRTGELFGLGAGSVLDDMTSSLMADRIYKSNFDFIQSITYAGDLFLAIYKIIEKRREGVYHVASAASMSLGDAADYLDRDYKVSRAKLIIEKDIKITVPYKCELITLKAETDLSFRMTSFADGIQAYLNSKIIFPK